MKTGKQHDARLARLALTILSSCYLLSCAPSGGDGGGTESPAKEINTVSLPDSNLRNEPIKPIPLHIDLDERLVALGEKLYNDPLLSRDNTISCATCHNLSLGGTDRKRFSTGINDSLGKINSPTVFNVGFNFKQFWDGRARTLEEQASGPIENELEMDSNIPDIIAKLSQIPEYAEEFQSASPDGMNEETIRRALAEFMRSLYTPNSRFDQYLRGDDDAITEMEKQGYQLFKSYGCITCHQGVGVGGNMFATLGSMFDYFEDRGDITEADYGRFNVTGREVDRYSFKVPSLRNVSLTPPYFHDGTALRLEDAVSVMAKYQLGRTISDDVADLIAQFLRTLTGDYRDNPL